jgi:DNA-binding NtrC family response regulator
LSPSLNGIGVKPEAMQALMAYSWPGNVRELANVLERAQILAENHVITLEDLPENIVSAAPATSEEPGDPRHLREVERRHVQTILQQEKGNKVHVARILGISRRSLYRLIEKYHLE